ncbi:Transcriptional protein SWT1 [Oopsacas minuta]|uniref:Transcriptional protein SWT1 n=1 Tax=Oopsacas minuta TaxID=111878 RepID=A0AAV7K9J0_9METZ|nr:Transcriptional protein SWT1 [Oopsacas minuta]
MATDNSGDVILMDVDPVEQRVVDELMTIRHTTCIEQMDYESSFSDTLLSSSNQAVVMQTNSLILVIDTNILLSNLSFLMELRTILFPNISKILFLIPWVVLQELDYIKSSNPNLNKTARQAINFLHQEFNDRSKNVIGQTMDADLAFVQKQSGVRFNNDDRILHCCLEQAKKWTGVNVLVVMFSNDKNLVTKCQVNGANVVSRVNILQFLRDITPPQDYTQLSSPPPSQPQDTPCTSINTYALPIACNTTYTDALDYAISISRPVLAVLIEDKMKFIFGNLWVQICVVKPPWSMLDVLTLLEKHWIAVFTDFSKRNVCESVSGMRTCLLDAEKNGCGLNHLSYALEHLQNILYTFHQHIPRCEEMLSILTGLQREIPNFMTSPPNQGTLSLIETRAVTSVQSTTSQTSPLQPNSQSYSPPPPAITTSSALDWALSSILDYIRILTSPTQSCSKEFITLLEEFLHNMDYIASEIPNVSPTNLEGFTNSLNAMLSHSASTVAGTHSLHITLSTYQKNSWGDFLLELLPDAINKAIQRDIDFRRGLPLQCFSYIGHQPPQTEEDKIKRQEFRTQTLTLLHKLTNYINIDVTADKKCISHIHESLPPSLTNLESSTSAIGITRWDRSSPLKQVNIELTTNIRLLRPDSIRLA